MDDLSALDFKKKVKPHTALLGVDYGLKRIGLALSDLLWMSATPLEIVEKKEKVLDIIRTREVGGVVIGLPRQMNGMEGSQAQLTRKWGEWLNKETDLPILFWDERLSSCAVTRLFVEQADLSRKRQKQLLDKVAAAYILQGALDLLSNI